MSEISPMYHLKKCFCLRYSFLSFNHHPGILERFSCILSESIFCCRLHSQRIAVQTRRALAANQFLIFSTFQRTHFSFRCVTNCKRYLECIFYAKGNWFIIFFFLTDYRKLGWNLAPLITSVWCLYKLGGFQVKHYRNKQRILQITTSKEV